MSAEEAHWVPLCTPPGRPAQQSSSSPASMLTLKVSRKRSAQGLLLWLSLHLQCLGVPLVFFSPHEGMHCWGDTPAERDPTLVCGWYSSLGVHHHSLLRKSWPLRVQSVTMLEQRVLWVNSLTFFPSMVKFPYWRVTNSSILKNMMSVLVIQIQD